MQPVSGLEVEVMLFVQAILAGAGLFLVYDGHTTYFCAWNYLGIY